MSAPTLFVVDDDPDARRGTAALACSLGYPCKTFISAEEFLQAYDPSATGCLLVDFRLGGMSGLELQEQLQSMGCSLPFVLISAFADVPIAVRGMRNGAVAVLQKPYVDDELVDAIRRGMELVEHRHARSQRHNEIRRRMAVLSERERLVMEMIVVGKPNKVIARNLVISHRTVDRIRASVFEKMGTDSAVELAGILAELQTALEDGRDVLPRPPHMRLRAAWPAGAPLAHSTMLGGTEMSASPGF